MTPSENERRPFTVTLPQGTLHYTDQGTGPVLVFVHGLLANQVLWSRVIPLLADHFRCIAPTLPLGAHMLPMPPDTDLSPRGIADILADFLTALDLHDVTLVGNDTGGALCQLVIAHHSERIQRLVLTNCDAFEQFFPPLVSPFHYGSHFFGIHFANFLAWGLRSQFTQRVFVGALAHQALAPAEREALFLPLIQQQAIRRDMTHFLRAVTKRDTLEAAQQFAAFRHPVLLVWGKDDRFFSMKLAERLQQAFPDARLERLDKARAFVPLDQPHRFAHLLTEFVDATSDTGG